MNPLDYHVAGERLTYRPIRAGDVGIVADCFSDWQPHHTGHRWTVQQSVTGTQRLLERQREVRLPLTETSSHGETLIAFDGEVPVGISVSECEGRAIHAKNQAVAPQHRGRGYWHHLVADLVTFAFECQGAEVITFELWADSGAANRMIEAQALERDGQPTTGPKTGRAIQPIRITPAQWQASGRAVDVTWSGI